MVTDLKPVTCAWRGIGNRNPPPRRIILSAVSRC